MWPDISLRRLCGALGLSPFTGQRAAGRCAAPAVQGAVGRKAVCWRLESGQAVMHPWEAFIYL